MPGLRSFFSRTQPNTSNQLEQQQATAKPYKRTNPLNVFQKLSDHCGTSNHVKTTLRVASREFHQESQVANAAHELACALAEELGKSDDNSSATKDKIIQLQDIALKSKAHAEKMTALENKAEQTLAQIQKRDKQLGNALVLTPLVGSSMSLATANVVGVVVGASAAIALPIVAGAGACSFAALAGLAAREKFTKDSALDKCFGFISEASEALKQAGTDWNASTIKDEIETIKAGAGLNTEANQAASEKIETLSERLDKANSKLSEPSNTSFIEKLKESNATLQAAKDAAQNSDTPNAKETALQNAIAETRASAEYDPSHFQKIATTDANLITKKARFFGTKKTFDMANKGHLLNEAQMDFALAKHRKHELKLAVVEAKKPAASTISLPEIA